jgi:Ras-related protein Rab-5C
MAEPPTYGAKVVLLGQQDVGKTCLGVRFVEGRYQKFDNTVGAAFLMKTLEMKDDHIKFEIWDTAGQERFRSFAPMYYRNASAAIIVYDITNSDSFKKARSWLEELRLQLENEVVICICGNKVDLADSERQVSREVAPPPPPHAQP